MSDFTVKRIRDLDSLLAHWPFILKGVNSFNRLFDVNDGLSPETFFRVILDHMALGESGCQVALYYNGESDPIGYTISFAENNPYHPPSVIVYAMYFDRTIVGASRYAVSHIEAWSRKNGYKQLKAFSPRFTGRSFALIEKRWGFKRRLVEFSKQL